MAPRKKRSIKQLEELPGLFDDITLEIQTPNRVTKIIEEHRKQQKSAHGLNLDIDAAALKERYELQFLSMGSGSSGNCAYLGIPHQGGILIDAGVDAEKVLAALKNNAIPESSIKGIVLTHDHGDHVRYAYALLRKLQKAQLYCTPRTLNGILRRHSISKRIKDYHKQINKEFSFEVGPFTVTPFEVSHDGTDNAGFSISAYGYNFVVATDMGYIGPRADEYIRAANYLMIEANYDAAMLEAGSYPEYLKARIRGEKGHLDNMVTAKYLASAWTQRLSDIYLCHLSHDNNRPELALSAVTKALKEKGAIVGDDSGSYEARQAQVRISVLPRFEASQLFVHRLDLAK